MSYQTQTAVFEQKTFRKPQFNLLLWSMLALIASKGLVSLFSPHGVKREKRDPGVPPGAAPFCLSRMLRDHTGRPAPGPVVRVVVVAVVVASKARFTLVSPHLEGSFKEANHLPLRGQSPNDGAPPRLSGTGPFSGDRSCHQASEWLAHVTAS